jgi:hypothetical protein
MVTIRELLHLPSSLLGHEDVVGLVGQLLAAVRDVADTVTGVDLKPKVHVSQTFLVPGDAFYQTCSGTRRRLQEGYWTLGSYSACVRACERASVRAPLPFGSFPYFLIATEFVGLETIDN